MPSRPTSSARLSHISSVSLGSIATQPKPVAKAQFPTAAGLAIVALLLVIWHVSWRYGANDNRVSLDERASPCLDTSAVASLPVPPADLCLHQVDASWLQHGSCFVPFLDGLAAVSL